MSFSALQAKKRGELVVLPGFPGLGLRFFVFDPALRKLPFVFVKITNLDQGRPDLQGGLNLVYDIVHDSRDILLKKIRFKPIEGTREIFSE